MNDVHEPIYKSILNPHVFALTNPNTNITKGKEYSERRSNCKECVNLMYKDRSQMRNNIHSKLKIDLICIKNFIKNQLRSSSKIQTFTSENLQEAEGQKIEQATLSCRKRKQEITQSKNQPEISFLLP